MYCSKCGAENADHARFCGKCGAELVQMPKEESGEQTSCAVEYTETQQAMEEEEIKKLQEALDTEEIQSVYGSDGTETGEAPEDSVLAGESADMDELNDEDAREAEQQAAKRRKRFRAVAAAGISVVLIAGITTGVYFGMKDKQEKTFQTKIAKADKYLEEMEYEKAEELYLESIKIDPKERKSYEKLAEIYTAQGKTEKAESIMKKADQNGAVAKKPSGQDAAEPVSPDKGTEGKDPKPEEQKPAGQKPSKEEDEKKPSKEEDKKPSGEEQEKEENDSDSKEEAKAASLETYVEKVLVPKYGTCSAGTYESEYVTEDAAKKIVQPERLEKQKGVLASKLKDFDGDGKKELLVLMLKTGEKDKTDQSKTCNNVYLQMYETKDKGVKLAAEYLALPNVMGQAETERQGIFLKESGGKTYICGSTANQYSLTVRAHAYGMFAVTYDGTFKEYTGTKGLITGEAYEKEAADISAKLGAIGLTETAKRMKEHSELWFEFDEADTEVLAEITTTEQNGTKELNAFYETYDPAALKPVERKVTTKFGKKETEAAAKRTAERLKKEQKTEEAYQGILDTYNEALLMGASEVQESPESYPEINPLLVFLTETSQGSSEIVHTLYDIDENGTKELLIGSRSKDADARVVGIYCFDGADAKNMFEDDTLAERSLLQIYQNGTIYIYGSGGASYGIADFYRIDGEDAVIQTEEYTFDMDGHPDRPYYNDSESLTKEEFQKKLDNMGKPVTGLEWKALSERITGETDAAKQAEEAKKAEAAKKAEEAKKAEAEKAKKAEAEKAKKDAEAKKQAEEAKKAEAEKEKEQQQTAQKDPGNSETQGNTESQTNPQGEGAPAYSDQEILARLEEYYAKGTADAKGEEMTVVESEGTESEYRASVRTNVPGNATATQVLYEVTVDKITGETTQKRVLTDGQVVTFFLWEK